MGGRFKQYRVGLLLVQLVAGCSSSPEADNGAVNVNHMMDVASPQAAQTPAADEKLVIAFGDSLYAGYNLAQGEGFSPVLEKALKSQGLKARVFNAGVSGDTSAVGLQRLTFTLEGLARKPDLVIVGLGGNDMLRGLNPEETRNNLVAILTELQKQGIPALLTGMMAAPNMGPDYAKAFNPIYPELARQFGVPLYPFFLEGVISHPDLLLPDGIHPNPKGVSQIVEQIAPVVDEVLREQGEEKPAP